MVSPLIVRLIWPFGPYRFLKREEQQGKAGCDIWDIVPIETSVFGPDGSLNSLNGYFEWRDMFGHHGPNHIVRDLVVFMAENIADSENLFPWNVRREVKQFLRYVSRCL